MPLKSWIQELKEELVATATKAKLEGMGVDNSRFLESTREAVLSGVPATTSSLKKVITAYGLAQSAGRKGVPIVDNFFDELEHKTRNLDRRSPIFKKLYDRTTSWVVEMASFGVIFKGITDLSDRQQSIIDIDLQATGKLNGILKLAVPQMEYEKAAVIGKKFNVDAEHVAISAFEFANWYGREADMRDFEYIASIARHTGQSYDDIWKEIQTRTVDLGETFEQAAYGVQDVVASQQSLERYQRELNVPRENIMGARDFAETMRKVREVSKSMPKDARVMNKVILETLKRATGTVESKAGQEKIAEGMAKILETDPLISEQLGISVEKKIAEAADKIVAGHGGNFDRNRAESEAISKMFGVAYAADAEAIWKAYKKENFDQFQSRRDLGLLYSKLPKGMGETLQLVKDFATVGGTNPQTLMFYLRDHGVPNESIPAFIKMASTGKIEEIAKEMIALDDTTEAELKDGAARRTEVVGKALPWLSDILGTIRGGKEVLLSSPFTKIFGGLAALFALNKFRKFQDAAVVSGINEVTIKLLQTASASGVEKATSLLGSLPLPGQAGKLGKALALGQKLAGNKTVQALGLAAATTGAIYASTRSNSNSETLSAVSDAEKNAGKAVMESTPKVVESTTRDFTDKLASSERAASNHSQTPPPAKRRTMDFATEEDFIGAVKGFGDAKPRIEISGFASRYVDAANKAANG